MKTYLITRTGTYVATIEIEVEDNETIEQLMNDLLMDDMEIDIDINEQTIEEVL